MYYILIWTNHDGVFSWLPSLVYRLYRSRPRWCALLLLSLTIYNVLGYYYELQLARRLVILYQIFKCGKFIFFPRLGDLLFTSISDRHFIFFIDPWVTQRDPDIYSRQYTYKYIHGKRREKLCSRNSEKKVLRVRLLHHHRTPSCTAICITVAACCVERNRSSVASHFLLFM
jgi:hypothetical protein